MTKEITKAIILQEIQNKFSLREYEPEMFLFSEKVVPTYDIGDHVKNWITYRDRTAISANGVIYTHNIPDDKQWRVRRIVVINETGGNFDIDQVFFHMDVNNAQYLFYNTASPIANGIVKIFELPQDVTMNTDALYTLALNISNYVAGGYVSVHMYREVETLR